MDHAARHALRIERAPSVLAELKAQIEAIEAANRTEGCRKMPCRVGLMGVPIQPEGSNRVCDSTR